MDGHALILTFVVLDTNANGKSYVFISTEKTWQEAQAYCREYHTDLALIENAEDNEAVRSLNAQSIAWIGLYRVPWTWSDKSSSNFTNWASGSPDNIDGDEHCVAEYLDSKWHDTPCQDENTLLCHEDGKLKSILRVKLQSDADLTDEAVSTKILQQMSTLLTKQGWTDFSLRWNIQPRKLKEVKAAGSDCGVK
ncbi:C-type lectin BML-2 isoform X2 [Lates calcarifer]|uniref:C-type lectin BML-2 isoform X2 n=1 Tax=Lates calcarifer TaxID=8187 RepID=A0AAJ8BL10_LATCA|nr:C-type lectin BML-2 isoform X2 [Lates calcarifer]